MEEVTNYTKAGGGYGECLDTIQDILGEELGKPKLKEFNPALKSIMTNVQRM